MMITSKTHRILWIFLFSFLSIALRVWHLEVVQREEKLLEAQKPQQRTILVRANRGTVCDRFQIPIAINRICYNAAVYYAQITQIPTATWNGQIKTYTRKEYIRRLSAMLAKTLDLDAVRLEDLIHSKAALFPHVPFLIKANISEEEHSQLRMLEKDWPGVYAEIASVRSYPLGKVGGNLIGTMGAIDQKEYLAIAQEIKELHMRADFYGMEEMDRLTELKEKAYAIDDWVGKLGIEKQCEKNLRGVFGKKIFEVDQKGCFIREIFRKEAVAGKKVVLSISAELQEFAETLLMQNEKTRDGRSLGFDPADQTRKVQKQPWIKGGAIVVLDPKTGEILTLASHPRFDPNDFIRGRIQVNRWLENEHFIAALWDGTAVLQRERGHKEENQPLTWEFYLDLVLPKDGPLRAFLNRMDDVKGAIQFQEDYEAMLYFTRSGLPIPPEIQKRLDAANLSAQDKLFAADLCRVAVYAPAFTDALIERIGSMKISTYRALCQAFQKHEAEVRKKAQEEFRKKDFREWREKHQKRFLKEKRKEEKEKRTYARPYIDYLDQKEKELFAEYWEKHRVCKLVSPKFSEDLIRSFRSFSQLNRPLLGKYKKKQTEKDLAAAFYPAGGFGFSRSFGFEASFPQGSIFKLITAYEALRQGKTLTIIDELNPQGVAYTPNRVPYPRFYKGGRLPRSAAAAIGKIDLIGAIEQTSNPYFSILAGDCLEDPEDLAKAAKLFGFGEKTGIELPRERKGKVPTDLKTNRTGLYSTAIGQHTLLTTPLQTACMLAAIANGGKLLKPKIILEEPPETRHIVPMDGRIRNTLLEGMDRVIWGPKGSARPSAVKTLLSNPLLMRDYLALRHQIVGKTGTAEFLCNFSANPSSPPQIYKTVWFGAISFTDIRREDPELVIVVSLRYGDAGKEAAPLAAQIVHKWREIKKKRGF